MANYGKNSELAKFLMESDGYDKIATAVKFHAIANRGKLEFLDNHDTHIEFEDVFIKYVLNVTIDENTVEFDAVVEGVFSYKSGSRYYDFNDETGHQWFSLHCAMQITDKLDSFKVTSIETYYDSEKRNLAGAATGDFVPVIFKDAFDDEATNFLEKWCPQALEEPMCVPIREIAESSMGLKLVDHIQLSKDLSIFGQICFADGEIFTYDVAQDGYVKTPVQRGTVFIDPNTYFLRCLGCANNTIAHEAFHWDRHRVYATVKSILNKQHTFQRCPTAPKGNIVRESITSNEDWMEWQANGIAPKILMPKAQTMKKISELVATHNYSKSDEPDHGKLRAIIDDLSDFYQVSKQAAKIRMIELGYPEATEVYNYDSNCTYFSNEISLDDAYLECENNADFETLFGMGLFRNVEGYFVVDTPEYRIKSEDGSYVLSDYSRENLSQSTLQFEYNIIELFEFNRAGGVLYREKQAREARPPQNIFSPVCNKALIDEALAQVDVLQAEIDILKSFFGETASQTIRRLMAEKKWQSAIFQMKTGLNQDIFRKINNSSNKKLSLPVVVSICIGLELPQEVSYSLIEQAGYKLAGNCIEDIVYTRAISGVFPKDIPAINALIEEIEARNPGERIRLLGSQFYGGKE